MGKGDQKEEEEEKWVSHYSSKHQILLVGEWDFSFSSSLASCFGSAINICATSLDSQDKVMEKYKNAKSNLENIKKLGASVLHGVDAIMMTHHPDLKTRKFDRIIFNFPHASFYRKEDDPDTIKNLVRGFFMSAREMLRENGQIHVSHKTSDPYCRWNLEELACTSNLAVIERVEFRKDDYPGYNNKRGASERCDEAFPLGACSTFKFRFSPRDKRKRMSEAAVTSLDSRQFQHRSDLIKLQQQHHHQPKRNTSGFSYHIADTRSRLRALVQTYGSAAPCDNVSSLVHKRLRPSFDYHHLHERHSEFRVLSSLINSFNAGDSFLR